MKKDDLIEECKQFNIDSTGTAAALKERLKDARAKKENNSSSIAMLFKNYEQSNSKE